MKKVLLLASAVTVSSLLFISYQAFGQDVDISTKMDDQVFKSYCLNEFDTNKDGKISIEEALLVSEIDVGGNEIQSLKGIEFFTSITSLSCGWNQLTSLDISKNTALAELYCSNNQLTSLDVSKNKKLERLDCEGNQITNLDVSNNSLLAALVCGNNQLTNLDVSKNTALTSLYCEGNQLKNLDVSKNTALEMFGCGFNQLTSLDVSKNKKLERLNCEGNQLTSLDVSNNIALTGLFCDKNPLTGLNIGNNSALREYEKRIIAAARKAASVEIDDPVFKSYCLKNFDTNKDGEISIEEASLVREIDVQQMGIHSLKGIEYFVNVTSLDCRVNQLTQLDVSKNTKLEKLWCGDNQLTKLDVSKNTALVELGCSYCQLVSLNVNNNTALKRLLCRSNQLTRLDISKNTALTELDCGLNKLTQLDISKNTALTELDCSDNLLTSLDISRNTNLSELVYNNNKIKEGSIKGIKPEKGNNSTGSNNTVNEREVITFSTSMDVFDFVQSRVFKSSDGITLDITPYGVTANGRTITGAVQVTYIQPQQAILKATSPANGHTYTFIAYADRNCIVCSDDNTMYFGKK